MITKIVLIMLAEFCLIQAQFTTPDSKLRLLLGEKHKSNVTVDYSLDNCTQIWFYAVLEYIVEVQQTGTYKQQNQLYCEIEIHAKDLGRTSIWGNITICNKNCTSISNPFIHITVEQSLLLNWISTICGWIYISTWSMTFYPQIYLNWHRKSVVGFNFDFVTLNLLGYVCYSMFNIGLYYLPAVEEDYFQRHPGGTNPVQLNDVVFSVHGLLVTAYMIVQVFIYERGGQSVSRVGVILLSLLLVTLGVSIAGGVLRIVSWLECLYYCSYIKLVVTATKYIPQVIMNYRLKSTSGLSIYTVIFDSLGSIFSILQMITISINRNDWMSIMGDPTKFSLGLFSVTFDIIFFTQHFILYRHQEPLEMKPKPDLTGTENPMYCKHLNRVENSVLSFK